MSDSTTQDIHPDLPELPTDAPKAPVKKKAAKKTAKKAAKKTTKSAKKAAKKTAKKATSRVKAKATDPAQTELPLPTTPPPAPAPLEIKTAPAEIKTPPAETHSDKHHDAPEPRDDQHRPTDPPKMGRVKGLGPVNKKAKQGNHPDRNQRREQGEQRRQDDPDSPREGRRNRGGNSRRGNKKHSNRDHQNRDNRDNQKRDNRDHQKRDNRDNQKRDNRDNRDNRERPPKREVALTGDPVDVNGMLEIAPKGFGFLRIPEKNFEQCKKDVFVPPDFIRKHGLRPGVWIDGTCQEGSRGPQLTSIKTVNELEPNNAFKLPHFEELKAINPTRRIAFESTPDRFTTRVLDIIAPVGRGQRGLIVSPPRSGKTTMLLHMAEAINDQYDESIHLIILLVDERPEEVTEFRRSLPGVEIYASSNDDPSRNHSRIAELCIERAKRLVEGGKDVLILMDSITRLARAYNNASGGDSKSKGRGYQSGGIVAGALEMPRRIFAAARNTRDAGSLTILATALIQTNSRADEAIFQEFKGTGNMELVLDRRIAEQYIYPAVDIFKSGTRREELIMADHLLHKINLIRRGLSGHRPEEAMERLLFFLKKFPNNAQMLMEIKG